MHGDCPSMAPANLPGHLQALEAQVAAESFRRKELEQEWQALKAECMPKENLAQSDEGGLLASSFEALPPYPAMTEFSEPSAFGYSPVSVMQAVPSAPPAPVAVQPEQVAESLLSPSLSDSAATSSNSFENVGLELWAETQVGEWLRARMLELHIATFRDNGIKGPALAHLAKDDLVDMGITIRAHQTVILNDLAKFKGAE
eukprot:m.153940 g.153940  ORF g.153940 m.153940 type:complete len:201 (+) comp52874_c0_seq2:490-1092(+)